MKTVDSLKVNRILFAPTTLRYTSIILATCFFLVFCSCGSKYAVPMSDEDASTIDRLIQSAMSDVSTDQREKSAVEIQCILNSRLPPKKDIKKRVPGIGSYYDQLASKWLKKPENEMCSKIEANSNIRKLALMLLQPEIYDKYGLLRLEYFYILEEHTYEMGRTLTTIDYVVNLYSVKGRRILTKQFTAMKPSEREEFNIGRDKTKKGSIDVYLIRDALLTQ